MAEQRIADIGFKFVEYINRLDLTGLVGLMADDHKFLVNDELHGEGFAEMTKGWHGYFTQFPDYMIHLCEVYEVGDEVVMVGRTTGSHLNQPRMVEFPDTLIWIAKVRDGKVSEWRIHDDTQENRKRLGIS